MRGNRHADVVDYDRQQHGSLYLLARAGCWLSIGCMCCNKVSEVDPQPFVDRFWRRVDTSLDNLGDRFRCTSCGYKGAILSAIEGPPATYAIGVPIPIYRRVTSGRTPKFGSLQVD